MSVSLAWLLLLAPLLGRAEPGWERALVALGYSLGCLSALLAPLATVLRHEVLTVAAATLIWTLLTVAPWLLARGRSATMHFVGGLCALALTALPPLGAVDPLTPAVGATAWAEGLGAWGLAAYASLFSLLIVLTARPRSRPLWLCAAGLVLLLLFGATPHASLPSPRAVGLSGHWGAEPRSRAAQKRRIEFLSHLLERTCRAHPTARLYVLPEFFLGRFDRGVAHWLSPLARNLARHHSEAIAGAAVGLRDSSGGTRWTDGAVAFGESRALIVTRQPAPLAEWRPGQPGSFPTYWWPWSHPPAGTHLGGFVESYGHGGPRRIAVAICYAGTLAWTWLWSIRHGTPSLVAAPESFLWTRARGPRRLETRLVDAWGRLYAIPVVFARALPASARGGRTRVLSTRARGQKPVPAPRPTVRAGHPPIGLHGDVDQVARAAIVAGHHTGQALIHVAEKLPNALDRRRSDAQRPAAALMQPVGAEKRLEMG